MPDQEVDTLTAQTAFDEDHELVLQLPGNDPPRRMELGVLADEMPVRKFQEWTTAQRPTGGGSEFFVGYNTTLDYPEYTADGGSTWTPFSQRTLEQTAQGSVVSLAVVDQWYTIRSTTVTANARALFIGVTFERQSGDDSAIRVEAAIRVGATDYSNRVQAMEGELTIDGAARTAKIGLHAFVDSLTPGTDYTVTARARTVTTHGTLVQRRLAASIDVLN